MLHQASMVTGRSCGKRHRMYIQRHRHAHARQLQLESDGIETAFNELTDRRRPQGVTLPLNTATHSLPRAPKHCHSLTDTRIHQHSFSLTLVLTHSLTFACTHTLETTVAVTIAATATVSVTVRTIVALTVTVRISSLPCRSVAVVVTVVH